MGQSVADLSTKDRKMSTQRYYVQFRRRATTLRDQFDDLPRVLSRTTTRSSRRSFGTMGGEGGLLYLGTKEGSESRVM